MHAYWMRQALELAALGTNTTTPNPAVGCVLVDAAGAKVGEGYHQQAGGPMRRYMPCALLRANGRAAPPPMSP